MRKKFEEKGYSYGVSYTTRPMREGEVNGKDYFFLTKEEFDSMVENGEFYEYVSFNGWFYGTSVEQIHSDDLFIMTPHGVSKLTSEDRKTSMVLFIDIDDETRKARLMERADADKVDRRILADNLDFADFTDFDIRVTNSNF